MKHTLELTDTTFESEVLRSATPVIVDFWASWCGPCKMLAPVLEEIAADLAGQVKVAKLDVDEFPEVAARYGVQALPTLLYFSDGVVRDKQVGLASRKVLLAKIPPRAATPAAAAPAAA